MIDVIMFCWRGAEYIMEFLHTKEKILTGMLKLIWEVGLERSSIALLSQKIKISPGNIYYYYKGKKKLLILYVFIVLISLTAL